MELRTNRQSSEEFEEVESPYASKAQSRTSGRQERLRTRKDVFNRPFASAAPAIFETTATRRSIGHADTTELIDTRQSELSETEIEYLEEEEDSEPEAQKKSVRNTSSKKQSKNKVHILPRIGWAVIGLLVLRLVCMDRGVWDWFATENVIKEKKEELASLQRENKTIKSEIGLIQIDKSYQKQLAKEHLGVIAADEFLILFAGEIPDTANATEDRNI